MGDKAFMKLIKKLSRPNEEIDHNVLNDEIVRLFPNKEYLREAKGAKNYFIHLVPYYMTIIDKKLITTMFKDLELVYRKMYPNLSTLDKALSKDIRVPLFTRFGRNSEIHKIAKAGIKLKHEEKQEVVKKQIDSLKNQSGDVNEYNTEEVFKVILKEIDSEDEYKVACALALASGSRPIEIFDREVEFTKVDEHWVKQWKVAKKRGKEFTLEKPIIGISAEKFIQKIDEMRWFIHDKNRNVLNSKGELNKKIQSKANDTMKVIMDYVGGITMYSARKIYADLSFKIYAKGSRHGDNPNLEIWRQAVLGHDEKDFRSGVHYGNFKSVEGDGGSGSAKISILEAKVEKLEEIVENKSVIKVDKPVVIMGKKQSKQNDYLARVKFEYDKLTKKPKQTEAEVLFKHLVPRSYIRLFYKTLK